MSRIRQLQGQVNQLMRNAFVDPFDRMRSFFDDFHPIDRMRESARRARERMAHSSDLSLKGDNADAWPSILSKDVDWVPPVDVRESPDGSAFLVHAEVPGMDSVCCKYYHISPIDG